jgi:hypothetical protein
MGINQGVQTLTGDTSSTSNANSQATPANKISSR